MTKNMKIYPKGNTVAVYPYAFKLETGETYTYDGREYNETADMDFAQDTRHVGAFPSALFRIDEIQDPANCDRIIQELDDYFSQPELPRLTAEQYLTGAVASMLQQYIFHPDLATERKGILTNFTLYNIKDHQRKKGEDAVPLTKDERLNSRYVQAHFEEIFAYFGEGRCQELWNQYTQIAHVPDADFKEGAVFLSDLMQEICEQHPEHILSLVNAIEAVAGNYGIATNERSSGPFGSTYIGPHMENLRVAYERGEHARNHAEAMYTELFEHYQGYEIPVASHNMEQAFIECFNQMDDFWKAGARATEISVVLPEEGETVDAIRPRGGMRFVLGKIGGTSTGSAIYLDSEEATNLPTVVEEIVHEIEARIREGGERFTGSEHWQDAIHHDLSDYENNPLLQFMYEEVYPRPFYEIHEFGMSKSNHAKALFKRIENWEEGERDRGHVTAEALVDMVHMERMLCQIIGRDGNLSVLTKKLREGVGRDFVIPRGADIDWFMGNAFPESWLLYRDQTPDAPSLVNELKSFMQESLRGEDIPEPPDLPVPQESLGFLDSVIRQASTEISRLFGGGNS